MRHMNWASWLGCRRWLSFVSILYLLLKFFSVNFLLISADSVDVMRFAAFFHLFIFFDSSSAITSTFFWVYFHSLLQCKWACILTSHFVKLCSVSLEIVKVMTLAIVCDRARTRDIDNSEVRTVSMHRTSCSLEQNNKQADLSAVQMQFGLITCWKYWCCCY